MAGASLQSPLGTAGTLSLGGQVSASFFGRETEARRAESVRPMFVEELVRTGVAGVGRLRCELRTLKQEGVFPGCGHASLCRAACQPDSTVMATVDCVDGPKSVSQSVSQHKRRKCTCANRLRWSVRVARLHGSPHRGSCCSRGSFLPHSAGSPPLPTLVCHFLSPARMRPVLLALLHQAFSFFCRYFNQTANAIKVSHRN